VTRKSAIINRNQRSAIQSISNQQSAIQIGDNGGVRRGLLIAFAIISSVSVTADPRFDAQYQPRQSELTYDGRFTFVRLRWESDFNFSRSGGFNSATIPRSVSW
jgi:hypothetical protein